MHDDRELAEGHVDRVFQERIAPAVYGAASPVALAVWDAPGEPVPVSVGLSATFTPVDVGHRWGPPWGTTWIRVEGRVPESWAGRAVELVIDLGFDPDEAGFQCEALAFGPDGAPLKGVHPRSGWVRVAAPARGGEPVLLYLEAAANPRLPRGRAQGPSRLGDPPDARRGPAAPGSERGGRGLEAAPLYRIEQAELRVFEEEVWALAQDVEVASELMRALPIADPRRWDLLRALVRAVDAIDPDDVPGTCAASRRALAGVLARPAHASAHRVAAVGHAHIDTAWLWPVRESMRKVARTLASALALMDEHPDFVFAFSQAQHAAWLEEQHPALFARAKAKVASGQLVPVGGMWVEADTNLTGGEALARQFVHGKRFYREKFGVETDVVWLPDCFGYSGALPQLIAQSPSRFFVTQKISWNQTNTFPHHTFAWEGIDGTRVLTHFPSADTYNGRLSGEELAHAVRSFADKGHSAVSLLPFGWGDGGGGPTREMLARAERLADLEGSPRVALRSPAAFFAEVTAERSDFPVWVGELYLELHRGTYTTQARTKRGNRRAELLLREAELWGATAAVRRGWAYPHEALDRLWKAVLVHQFHDILPGCSIAWVHRDAERVHAAVAAELEATIADAVRALAGEVCEAGGDEALWFNAAPYAEGGVPAMGAGRLTRPEAGCTVREDAGGVTLDNGLLRVHVDAAGLVDSVFDREREREVVPPGARANRLQIHPDLPNMWDAWDVDATYRTVVADLTDVASLEIEARGPEAASVRVVRAFGASRIVQRVTLRAGQRRVEFDTEVDWQEREKLLKLAFPVDVHADHASAEIQFGHVRRATHENTSWDAARFEVSAHRWVHVGEVGYGVALVNDATYGYDVQRQAREGGGTITTVRASLLRAPRYPDPEADRGAHAFRHALIPGATVADAVREGYRFNLPMRSVPSATGAIAPLIRVDHPAVVVEAVKLADDRSGDLVVRLYEAHGGRARARVVVDLGEGRRLARAFSTDLCERAWDRTTTYRPEDGSFDLALRPFEIVTLRLVHEPADGDPR